MKKVLVIKGGNFEANRIRQIELMLGSWHFELAQTNLSIGGSSNSWVLDGSARDAIRGHVIKKVRINANTAGTINVFKCTYADRFTHITGGSTQISTINVLEGIHEYDIPETFIDSNESIGFTTNGAKFYYTTNAGEPFSNYPNNADAVTNQNASINIAIYLEE